MKIIITFLLLVSNISFAQNNPEIDQALIDAKETERLLNQKPQEQQEPVEVKAEEPKTSTTTVKKDAKKLDFNPGKVFKLSKEESEMLKRRYKSLKDRPDLADDKDTKKVNNPIYQPAPVHFEKSSPQNEDSVRKSIIMERDSQLILHKFISYKDTLTVKICFKNALTLTMDDTIDTTLSTVVTDDVQFIGAQVTENKRGAIVHLKQEVPSGQYWESAIRLVRKSDDKTYLINLLALPCPTDELIPFPRVIYLKDKDSYQKSIYKNSQVTTPEDNIINKSLGLPRIQKKRINFYDMVASSGSDWVVFGVEMQMPGNTKEKIDLSKYKFVFLDNFQVNTVDSQIEYMPIPSEKITQMRGVSTFRFNAKVNINKEYIMNRRYLYFMLVDNEEKHYQYLKIDTLPYFRSLRSRGMEL